MADKRLVSLKQSTISLEKLPLCLNADKGVTNSGWKRKAGVILSSSYLLFDYRDIQGYIYRYIYIDTYIDTYMVIFQSHKGLGKQRRPIQQARPSFQSPFQPVIKARNPHREKQQQGKS